MAISGEADSPSPWTTVEGIDALRVPGHTQPDREPECLLYAIWMTLQYVASVYPSRSVRENTPVLQPDQMKEYITIRETGWSPDQDDLDALSEATEPVSWELKTWADAPPANIFDEVVEDGLEDAIPTIAIVDSMRLRGYERNGPLHAVVVTGMGDRRVVLNNPWGSMYDVHRRDGVIDAWDTTLNRLITIDLHEQATLQDTLIKAEDTGNE